MKFQISPLTEKYKSVLRRVTRLLVRVGLDLGLDGGDVTKRNLDTRPGGVFEGKAILGHKDTAVLGDVGGRRHGHPTGLMVVEAWGKEGSEQAGKAKRKVALHAKALHKE